ncbi:response regulator [Maridesulfovibrio hydrothermalis]|uniref:Response regulator receiver n=1 Tax=Maridesulfovibrio hydrothermalis AM13 = DSM 14728 TaxID=1121451 RepID=L0RBY1_9BACT|nr:response regulator [Maridesulfovibrio hydrothermalis]CCO23732.1 Response regulator receiver [Maridesulfovibrio hydrothermalis AM13 = DSM 14728]
MNNVQVLLVDDEEGFSSVLSKRLSKRKINVRIATGGEMALQLLSTEQFHVVVLDVKMPGMNGMQVLKVIKQRYPQVEVILLTGHADMDNALESMTAGAFDFLLKPANTEILIYRINDAAKAAKMKMSCRETELARPA